MDKIKKLLTLRNVLLCAAAVLVIVGFFVAFTVGFKMTDSGIELKMTHIIIGKQTFEAMGIVEPVEADEAVHAGLPLVGIILMLVAGLAAVAVGLLVKKPWAKWVLVGLAVVIVAGAVLSLFVREGYAISGADKAIKEGAITKAERADYIKMIKEEMLYFNYGGGYVVPMIMGALAAVGVGCAALLEDRQLLK